MESCYAKTAMSGVAGFGLGGLFGMFMASVSHSRPLPDLISLHCCTTTFPSPTPFADR